MAKVEPLALDSNTGRNNDIITIEQLESEETDSQHSLDTVEHENFGIETAKVAAMVAAMMVMSQRDPLCCENWCSCCHQSTCCVEKCCPTCNKCAICCNNCTQKIPCCTKRFNCTGKYGKYLPRYYFCCGIQEKFHFDSILMWLAFLIITIARWTVGILTLLHMGSYICSAIGVYTIIKAVEATVFWGVVLIVHHKARAMTEPQLAKFDIYVFFDTVASYIMFASVLFLLPDYFNNKCEEEYRPHSLVECCYVLWFVVDSGLGIVVLKYSILFLRKFIPWCLNECDKDNKRR